MLIAVTLASLGIYGVISFGVAQRTQEIGLRMAVGGNPSDVRRYILGRGLRLCLLGVGIGLVGALGVTRFMTSFLFETSPTDLTIFGGVSVVLIGVALTATYIPAFRASRIDPLVALQAE